MDTHVLFANLTNPTLLFFVLGILATAVRSDLAIPESTGKFLSLYLLFSIGFKGGQELAHEAFTAEIGYSILFGLALAALVPVYVFFIVKRRVSIADAGAVAAAYGSVSAVTFVAATAFLEAQKIPFGGHMVAVMALMEAPAIIVGVVLLQRYDPAAGGTSLGPPCGTRSPTAVCCSFWAACSSASSPTPSRPRVSSPSRPIFLRASWPCFCSTWAW